MLIDSHTHLLSENFDLDREEAIKRAKFKKIEKFIEVSYDRITSKKVKNFIENNNDFFGVIGIHPQNANELNNEILKLFENYAKSKKIIAIGEIGLDYFREIIPRNLQKKAFIEQIELALSLKKPIIIHCRDAKDDVKNILKKYPKLSGIIHSFSGTIKDADFFIEHEFLLGISGILTYKNNLPLKEIIKILNLENIVLETDCPYLPPVPHRGERNEPSFINFVKEEISKLKEIDTKVIEKITTNNIKKTFNINF